MSSRIRLGTRPVMAIVYAALMASAAGADDDVRKGEAIARESDERDQGYADSRVRAVMIIENRKGDTRERRLRISTLEARSGEEGEKSLVVFDEPRDIKGTALLSHARTEGHDDQWLFLPALKRVKRISSVNQSGPFVGSEFAYEDITGREIEKFSYRWLRNEPCGELECLVVERRPRYENSGYSRLVTWYDASEYRVQRIDYFDREGRLLKTLSFRNYRQYEERFWRAHELVMNNYLTGKKTRLRYEGYELQTGLTEKDFNQGRLRRER